MDSFIMYLFNITIVLFIAYVLLIYTLAQYSISKTNKEEVEVDDIFFLFVLYFLLEDMLEKFSGSDILIALLWLLSPIVVPIFWILLLALLALTAIFPSDDVLHPKGHY